MFSAVDHLGEAGVLEQHVALPAAVHYIIIIIIIRFISILIGKIQSSTIL